MLNNGAPWSLRTRRTALDLPLKPHIYLIKGKWYIAGIFGTKPRALHNYHAIASSDMLQIYHHVLKLNSIK